MTEGRGAWEQRIAVIFNVTPQPCPIWGTENGGVIALCGCNRHRETKMANEDYTARLRVPIRCRHHSDCELEWEGWCEACRPMESFVMVGLPSAQHGYSGEQTLNRRWWSCEHVPRESGSQGLTSTEGVDCCTEAQERQSEKKMGVASTGRSHGNFSIFRSLAFDSSRSPRLHIR